MIKINISTKKKIYGYKTIRICSGISIIDDISIYEGHYIWKVENRLNLDLHICYLSKNNEQIVIIYDKGNYTLNIYSDSSSVTTRKYKDINTIEQADNIINSIFIMQNIKLESISNIFNHPYRNGIYYLNEEKPTSI